MKPKLVLFFGLAVMGASPLLAQTFGGITGVISDSTGSLIRGATVTVTNPQTNFSRETISNETGTYNFPNLPPGLYNVRAAHQGFQTEIRNSVELQVQQTARIDFPLNPGSVTEEITVTGGAPLLNTENATVGTVIEQKRIEDLPMNGRSFISLIALSPNVTTGQASSGALSGARSGGERAAVSIAISGVRRTYTYFTLDGISNTDIDWNTYAFLPSIDALQEFKVQTGVYSAEFGREAAQVNISTKSGTNEYHGTVFEFLRNNKLDARPYGFTSKVPVSAPFKWNQYGFTLGGPIRIPKIFNGKNRLFFMSNYEGFKLRNEAQQTYSLPSAAMRSGNFSEILPTTAIKDQTTNVPFSGNIIPTERLHKVSQGLLEFLPLPNIPGAGLVNNYLALLGNTTDKDQFSQRIDLVESAKSSWFGRFSWQNDAVFNAGLKLQGSSITDRVYQTVISNTRVLTPTLVNEFRTGYLGYHNNNLTELAYKRNVNQELGLKLYYNPEPIAWGVPNIIIQGFSSPIPANGLFGNSTQAPWVANDHTFQWIDDLSWTHGKHSLKFGVEIRRDRYNEVGNQQPRGAFTFQNQATGYGFSDYMLGYIQTDADVGALAIARLRSTSQYYFVTDSWKVLPNLTIEAGLRFEYNPPYTSVSNNYANVIIPAPVLTVPGPGPQAIMVRDCAAFGENEFYIPQLPLVRLDQAVNPTCSSNYGGNPLVRKDWNDFAPRLGIAWSPTDKWTVRAGGGMFYAQDEANVYFDMTRNLVGRSTDTVDPLTNNLTWDHPFTINPGASKCGVASPPFICVTTPLGLGNDPNRHTPYLYQFTANVQRQLTSSTVLEAGYLTVLGHNLLSAMLPGQPLPGPGPTGPRNPYPAFTAVQVITGNVHSNYHAGSLKLTRRLTTGLSLLAGYTFSHSLDSGSAIGSENGSAPRQPQIGWCRRCEYGPSDFDTRHRFVVSGLYELPVGRGKQILNHGIASTILGGWQVNSIVTISSGFPVSLLDGTNRANVFYSLNRPDVVAGTPWKLDNPTPNQWFNIEAFRLQPQYTFGNAQRNVVLGPGIASWDFSTLKNFNFAERSYLQFRFECFNCANHPNFADPGNTLASNQFTPDGFVIPGTGPFGKVTSTRSGIDMRQLQFSLKLYF
jgi:hypothetical protein